MKSDTEHKVCFGDPEYRIGPEVLMVYSKSCSPGSEELFQLWRQTLRDIIDDLDLVMPTRKHQMKLVEAAHSSMWALYNTTLCRPPQAVLYRHIEQFLRDSLEVSAPNLQPKCRVVLNTEHETSGPGPTWADEEQWPFPVETNDGSHPPDPTQ